MKLSIVMHTCRKDTKQLPAPILEMMLDAMSGQTYEDIELIVVDLLWEKRRERMVEILEAKRPTFPVLHICDRSTPFRDRKLLRIAAPKNTGAMNARGDAVVFTDDCQVIPSKACEYLAEWAARGVGATMHYKKAIWHPTNEPRVTGVDARGVSNGIPPGDGRILPARQIGFLGGTMSMLPLEALLVTNGWDEMFDGSRQLEDADMILRLAANGQMMAYESFDSVIEYEVGSYDEDVVTTQAIKCNGAYAQHIWSTGRRQANRIDTRDAAIERMGWANCLRIKEDGECSPHMSPCTKMGAPEELREVYSDERLIFDLAEEREKAIRENEGLWRWL